tara:strand:- start:538 stop:795 length:258 start_codon:yes stop_codon:yes gene_type:complete
LFKLSNYPKVGILSNNIVKITKTGEKSSTNSITLIENDVIVECYITVKCGFYLWDEQLVENNIPIVSNAAFTNNKYPKSKVLPNS